MVSHYSSDNEWPSELFEAVAFGFEKAFQLWVPSQMVMCLRPSLRARGAGSGRDPDPTSGSLVSLKTPPPPRPSSGAG